MSYSAIRTLGKGERKDERENQDVDIRQDMSRSRKPGARLGNPDALRARWLSEDQILDIWTQTPAPGLRTRSRAA